MSRTKVAVLGGDVREIYIAGRLEDEGFEVRSFGGSATADGDGRARSAASAEDAVEGAEWIVCPSPGLGAGDVVYAPGSAERIVLDRRLLAGSRATEGGIVMGRATPNVLEAAKDLGVAVFEMKDDRSLAASNAKSVAEALVSLLVDRTDRILPEHRIVVVGYGATGSAFTKALLGLTCTGIRVAARRPSLLADFAADMAVGVPYEERVGAMAEAGIVVNTVPSPEAIPAAAFPLLAGTLVVDIASPPGGIDHEAAQRAGVDVTWARGLAGSRAPHSAGDAQLAFIRRSMGQMAVERDGVRAAD